MELNGDDTITMTRTEFNELSQAANEHNTFQSQTPHNISYFVFGMLTVIALILLLGELPVPI